MDHKFSISRRLNVLNSDWCTRNATNNKIKSYSSTILFLSSLLLLTTILSITQAALPVDQKCQPTGSFFCNIDNYNTVQPFNNTLGHTSLDAAKADLHRYAFLLDTCKSKTQLFLCSLYFPVCVSPPDVTNKLLLPCRDICEEALTCLPAMERIANMSWPSEWDCNNFEYYGRDHKLCVINNQKENQPIDNSDLAKSYDSSMPQPSPSQLKPVEQPNQLPQPPAHTLPDNTSICDPGFFDCRLSDPKRPLCIEIKYVCDGKKDCFRNDSIIEANEGLDEVECKERCADGELYCDDKCVSRYDICNGKVDCSSGIDEQACYNWNDLTSLIQIILCMLIIATLVVIVLRLRCGSGDSDDVQCEASCKEGSRGQPLIDPDIIDIQGSHHQPLRQSHNDLAQEPTYQEPSVIAKCNYGRITVGGFSGTSLRMKHDLDEASCEQDNLGPPLMDQDMVDIQDAIHHPLQLGSSLLNQDITGLHEQRHQTLHHQKPQQCHSPQDFIEEPMYQAPSILEKCDYERVNAGGYSGASSVYGGCSLTYVPVCTSSRVISEEPPAAPPPTPVPIVQNLYVNSHMKD